ncbi:Zinc finger protein 622, partial [Prunus dulcis]
MPGLTCNACNKELVDDADQKLHYKSEWHRYNLKRKVAGVPGVTETLFIARQDALAQEKNGLSETPMLYSCGLCGKGYRSSKAHAEHLKSRSHILRASQGTSDQEEKAIIRPLPSRVVNKAPPKRQESDEETEESEDEWEEVDSDEDLVGETAKSLTEMNVDEHASNEDMDEDDFEELDPSCCFMCDLEHDTIESCMVHMHKQHGFFIPDIEYLKIQKASLLILVKRDLLCLYCNNRRHPFNSLEAVRKHMSAKSHCKVHYGDGDDEEEAELEEFYDYSSSYVDEAGKQLVVSGDMANSVELGSGGSELIITRRSDDGTSTKTLGSRNICAIIARSCVITYKWYRHYSCISLKVQEHGVGDCAVKGTNGQDEGTEGNEKIGSGGYAQRYFFISGFFSWLSSGKICP